METNVNVDSSSTNNGFYIDNSIPLENLTVNTKRVFFHQFIAFQISKNPYLQLFAQQNLILTHPRSLYRVEFGDGGEFLITYNQGEDPVKYDVTLSKNLSIADISWSPKFSCYFNFLLGTPFVVDADIVALIYLAALENDLSPEVIGEWMRSATRGRYTGFNPVHLDKYIYQNS